MHCVNCGSSKMRLMAVNMLNTGDTEEQWQCDDCGRAETLIRKVGYGLGGAPLGYYQQTIPLSSGVVTFEPPTLGQPMTRLEKINTYWDACKKTIEEMPELERQMMYYILYQQGMRIDGLGYKIEDGISKKFPREKEKK